MKIARLDLITALISTISLLFLSYNLEPKTIDINEINEGKIGEFVKVTGFVTQVGKSRKITSFDLSDETNQIRIISFEKINISLKENLEVIGKVDKYYGLLEIEAQKIKRLG